MKSLDAIRISPQASIHTAMSAINDGAVEIALVVDSSGALVGTVTDGDIRRALLGGATLATPIHAFIHRNCCVVTRDVSRADVLDLMRARTLKQIPIVDADRRLVGMHLLHEIIGSAKRGNWAVVMAGGRGERLRPLTDAVPKPMLKVAGRPLLERIVLHLVGSGVQRIFIAVHYLSRTIEEYFGDGGGHGCRIEYLREQEPLGTGGALSLLPESPDQPVIVLNGDVITQFDAGGMLAFHQAGGFAVTIGTTEYVHTVPYGVVETEGDRVRTLEEKPTNMWQANAGIYVVSPETIRRIPAETRFAITSLIDDCLRCDEPVGAFGVGRDWIDVGLPKELARARGVATP